MCGQLTWCLREAGILPARGAEPVAASVPAHRHIPEHAVSLAPVHGAAAVPALRHGLAGRSRKRGAPSWGQAVLTPAPLTGSDAAEVPVPVCWVYPADGGRDAGAGPLLAVLARRGIVMAGCEGSKQTPAAGAAMADPGRGTGSSAVPLTQPRAWVRSRLHA